MQLYRLLTLLLCFVVLTARAQTAVDTVSVQTVSVSTSYLDQVRQKTARVDAAVTTGSERYLQKMAQTEARLLQKLGRTDAAAAAKLSPARYDQLLAKLKDPTAVAGTPYLPYMDTLNTSLSFLQNNPALTGATANLSSTMGQVNRLGTHLAESQAIDEYVQQRKAELKQLLASYTQLPTGVASTFNDLQKQTYYYREQMAAYKQTLSDPEKLEEKTIELLRKLPAYNAFLQKNSMLASLFQLPAASTNGVSAAAQGLQTRSQVQGILGQQIASGGPGAGAAAQGQLQNAQSQLNGIKDKLSQYGNSGSDLDMPDFKPNGQKTKTFLNRLEYGANVQFAKTTSYFPTTGDLGLSVGYKLNDKSTAGVGLAYKLGLGTGWRDIGFNSQGIGLRSFMDWKLKGTFYVTGGYELNYLSGFGSIAQLKDQSGWQRSALIGLEKKYQLSSKLKGNMQLLFDMLYKQQVPEGQWLKFRIGYNF